TEALFRAGVRRDSCYFWDLEAHESALAGT
ncbi:MAG: hypothetical protein ACI82H_002112, partial [Alphaproteobacteria bacterium]